MTSPPSATPSRGTPSPATASPGPNPGTSPETGWQPYDQLPRDTTTVSSGLLAGGTELMLDVTTSTEVTWAVRPLGNGIAEVEIMPDAPAAVRVAWQVPCVDTTAYWTPDSNEHRGLPQFWRRPRTSALEKAAPVGCLVGADDVAVCTFALREVVRPVRICAGVVEETGYFGFWAEHDAEPGTGLLLRLDLSGRPFSHTLADVATWWLANAVPTCSAVPRVARMPAYSTWYTMQQHVDAPGVERQARLAAELGCQAIIMDDGWHSDNRQRGYGYVGEWEPFPASFPDMAAHVARVHDDGLAYLLWYSLPFVGKHAALWDRVQPYILADKDRMDAAVVDPRYPVIRDLLVEKLARAVHEWGMDGLKIDFIDQFAVDDPPPAGPDADCATVNEGVHLLLKELGAALPPDALVELRQPYVSPGLWPYATMIRASDCALSPAHNRQRTVDLRLVAGPLAVHADMMMWHFAESPERVAAQLINVLFAVPQISVDLATQTPEQRAALRFWLQFFTEHADILQGGLFEPMRPDLVYPLVRAVGEETVIVGRYGPIPVPFEPGRTLLLANADDSTDVLLTVARPCTASATVLDCQGRPVSERTIELASGVHLIEVPTGGLLTLADLRKEAARDC
ncbi:glycoside hydrolase family 36 protein [Actinopolymorpha sp. B17G11]|uniref:glycoside hydrolase family 36 protein n=1 Tax=Actinopolymorpha sp. B17G11 TaxID=3160861 RepID=UPI0032E3E503